MANNLVIGRGKLYFDQFLTGTETKTGERYLGNTPALSMSSAYQNLDHYDSDAGVRVKDDSVQLQVDRTGTFQCDNISPENVALMFGATANVTAQGADTGRAETFTVQKDRVYQLGTDDPLTPQGVINVTNVVVTNASGLHAYGYVTVTQPTAADTFTVNGAAMTFRASAPAIHEVLIGATALDTAQAIKAEINAYPAIYDVEASGDAVVINLVAIASGTAGNSITLAEAVTDAGFLLSGATLSGGSASGVIALTGNYTLDAARGRVTILAAPAAISNDDVLEIDYDVAVGSRTIVVDEENQVEGALRFLADNPRGTNKDYFWPRVKLSPSGEFALKGEAWQTMTFNMEVLQSSVAATKRVYVTEV